MATRSDTVRMNAVSLFALIGGVVAFVLVGAVVDLLWVALGAFIGGAIGYGIRRFGTRAQAFAEAEELKENATKRDLERQAAELDIVGRSSMSKDELVEAITDARAN